MPSVADQIINTSAALLHSIPHAPMQFDIVHDLIKLQRDLRTLYSIGVFDDDDIAGGEGISVLIFSQILHDNDDVEKEFEVGLGTKEELLMLQLSVYQLLFQLFVMKNGQQSNDDLESEHIGPRDRFQMDGEHRGMLLRCIGQVLETSCSANNDFPSCDLISMQSNIVALDLLHLVLPEYYWQANVLGVRGSQWTEIMEVVMSSLQNHISYLESYGDEHGSNERVSKWMSDAVSSRMVSLLRNSFICPPFQSNLLPEQLWGLQSKFVHRLLDCLLPISKVRGITKESERLSSMTLCAIQVSLYPDANMDHYDLGPFVRSLFDYCNVNRLWNPCVSLLSTSSHSTVVSSILARLIDCCRDDVIVERACDVAIERNANNENKRRRLDQGSNYESRGCDDDDDDYLESVSLVSTLANYLLVPLKEIKELPMCSIDDLNNSDTNGEIELLMLQRGGLATIFDSIFTLESLLIQKGMVLTSNISVISVLKQFYEAGMLLSKIVIASCANGGLDYSIDGSQPRIVNLVGLMSRILHNESIMLVLCDDLNPIRQELSSLVFDATIQYWLLYSPPVKLGNVGIADIESPQPLDAIKESLTGLSNKQVEFANAYLKSHIVPCGKICRRLPHSLGIPVTNISNGNNNCTCHLFSGNWRKSTFICSNKGMADFEKSSFIIFIETTLPVRNW